MCRWAPQEFGEFLWLDWDTVLLRYPDQSFWEWCRRHGTPKFIHIREYWAIVNRGDYYAGSQWAEAMEHSFHAVVEVPNSELLWDSVLPKDVLDRKEFWLGVPSSAKLDRNGSAICRSSHLLCPCEAPRMGRSTARRRATRAGRRSRTRSASGSGSRRTRSCGAQAGCWTKPMAARGSRRMRWR